MSASARFAVPAPINKPSVNGELGSTLASGRQTRSTSRATIAVRIAVTGSSRPALWRPPASCVLLTIARYQPVVGDRSVSFTSVRSAHCLAAKSARKTTLAVIASRFSGSVLTGEVGSLGLLGSWRGRWCRKGLAAHSCTEDESRLGAARRTRRHAQGAGVGCSLPHGAGDAHPI